MRERRKPLNATAIAVTLVLSLLLLYVGSYLALVQQDILSIILSGSGRIEPKYQVGGKASEVIFLPAHFVDRHLRNDAWHFELENNELFNVDYRADVFFELELNSRP